MQSKYGQLLILDPHTESLKVFWNGVEISVVDVRIKKNNTTILVVAASTVLPVDLETHPNIEVVRK
jgi:hypothetical protein